MEQRSHNSIGAFSRYAANVGNIQKKIVELQAEPEKEKTLRRFPLTEAAEIIGLSERHLRNVTTDREDMPKGMVVGGNNRRAFSLAEINQIRATLYESTGEARYVPKLDPARGERMQVVTFANFKGGAAKTTSAIHFAQYMALRGYRVLAVDLDSQASLTSLFGYQPDLQLTDKDTLYPFFRGEAGLATAVRKTYWDGLDLIPANLGLYNTEFELPLLFKENPELRFWRILESGLPELEGRYDVVVIDCPPSLGYVTINGIFAATALVVPVPPSMIDLASTGQFFKMAVDTLTTLAQYEGSEAKEFQFVRVLASKFDTADLTHGQMYQIMAQAFGDGLMVNRMAKTTMLDLAGLQKETLYELAPSSGNRRTYERAMEYMNSVNKELEEAITRVWKRASSSKAEAA